jgi:cbb3-type cytochrome oxidase subunit 3
MLKYIKGHLSTIDGVEIFPIISLVIFFTVFIGVVIYVTKTKNKDINQLKNLPLDED